MNKTIRVRSQPHSPIARFLSVQGFSLPLAPLPIPNSGLEPSPCPLPPSQFRAGAFPLPPTIPRTPPSLMHTASWVLYVSVSINSASVSPSDVYVPYALCWWHGYFGSSEM